MRKKVSASDDGRERIDIKFCLETNAAQSVTAGQAAENLLHPVWSAQTRKSRSENPSVITWVSLNMLAF